MSNRILESHLQPLAQRQLRQRLHQATIGVLVVVVLSGVLLLVLRDGLAPLITWLWLAVSLLALVVTRALVRRQHAVDFARLASDVERQHPELRTALKTAVEQRAGADGLSYLQQRLIDEVVAHAKRHEWLAAVPARRLAWLSLASLLLFVGSATVAAGLLAGVRAPINNVADTPVPVVDDAVEVVPGNSEVERGTPVVVLARFPGQVPDKATLVIGPVGGVATRIELAKNLNDPVYATTVAGVGEALTYHIDFRVGVHRRTRLMSTTCRDSNVRMPRSIIRTTPAWRRAASKTPVRCR